MRLRCRSLPDPFLVWTAETISAANTRLVATSSNVSGGSFSENKRKGKWAQQQNDDEPR